MEHNALSWIAVATTTVLSVHAILSALGWDILMMVGSSWPVWVNNGILVALGAGGLVGAWYLFND